MGASMCIGTAMDGSSGSSDTVIGCGSRERREVVSNAVSREKAWKGMEDCRTSVWHVHVDLDADVDADVYVGRYG